MTDVVGVRSVNNELVADPIRRAESPEPIDEHLVDETIELYITDGKPLPPPTSGK